MLEYMNCEICGRLFQETTMDRGICSRHPHAERMEHLRKTVLARMPAREKAELKRRAKAGRKHGKKGNRKKKASTGGTGGPASRKPVADPKPHEETGQQQNSA